MGLFAEALSRLVPERKAAVGATIPTWDSGNPQAPRLPYSRYAQEGYGSNEVVYACIEELCTSAAEPKIAAYAEGGPEPEQLERHPAIDLLEQPNPFMSRFDLIAAIILHLEVAGTAYLEKARSRATGVVELWPLRPDRVRIIPDQQRFIGGYRYELGDVKLTLPPEDVIRLALRNPYDDYYGLPPLAVVARRVDTDNFMRDFTRSFFVNAGVPAGLLNVQRRVEQAERSVIQQRFRTEYGAGNWHSLLVLDNTEATYTPMGLPLGERGIVLPDLDEISEARIASVFGVPLELIGARLGMIHGNRSTTKEARASFWDETLTPLYQFIATGLSRGLVPEFSGLHHLDFDLSTVRALQEDEDARHNRIRSDMLAGLITREEARTALGHEPEVDQSETWVIQTNVVIEPVTPPEPDLAAAADGSQPMRGVPLDQQTEDAITARVSANGNGRAAH